MSLKFKEVRMLNDTVLRALCIDKNWYTMGNNEEYTKLFRKCRKTPLTTSNLVEMAEDIVNHSNIQYEGNYTELVAHVLFYLNKACDVIFEPIA